MTGSTMVSETPNLGSTVPYPGIAPPPGAAFPAKSKKKVTFKYLNLEFIHLPARQIRN